MYWDSYSNNSSFFWEGSYSFVPRTPHLLSPEGEVQYKYAQDLTKSYLDYEYGQIDKERELQLQVSNADIEKETSRLRARFSSSGLSGESFDAFLARQLESRNKEIEWINTEFDSRKKVISIEVANQLTSERTMERVLREAGISLPTKKKPRKTDPYDWLTGPGDLGATGTVGDSAAGLLGIGVAV